ncbi:DEAD/DEAH box helicase [Desulfopila aestuarii]|uniref:Helicase conserved C-terminal domain-containing protein n=1 Tax=Desulfopila aestuarii DSM 18488 TaxID=1121416 RepID=A0A1M7YJ63_9BACT|nr:DEAD/DEAH box helicase [Desulfopila aestuarii]SHO52657.1 Helicase conserved C-terminal domain-containing protein [Desulfopila aestuarii DSM 18488]
MYNLATDTIPSFLPVLEEVQLRSWFSRATLDEGLGLIRQGRISAFHVLRGCVGACIDLEASVTLQFEPSAKLSQGFVLRNNYCGLCGAGAQRKRCPHMAAVAILSLIAPWGQSQPRPVSLVYNDSFWAKIGEFFYDWLSRGKYTMRCEKQETSWFWQVEAADGRFAVHMPLSWQLLGEELFPGDMENDEAAVGKASVARLIGELQVLTMTAGERQLQNAGSVSVGWKRDNSFWSWLARMLFVGHGGAVPELSKDPVDSRFFLKLGKAGEPGSFSLELPQDRTWEVVKNIPYDEETVRILPVASECYHVFFNEENCVEVVPSLRLQDGRVLDRQEQSGSRFGGAWYLEGEGFLPISRLSAEGQFRNPCRRTTSLSLLGFLHAEEQKDIPFTVVPNDLAAFLRENEKPLHFVDNIVESQLLELEIRDFPDRLIIDSFREEGDSINLSCRYGLGTATISLGQIQAACKRKLSCLPGRLWLNLNGTPLSWFYELVEERHDAGGDRIRLSYLELFRLTALIPKVDVTVKEEYVKKQITEMLDAERWADGSMLSRIPRHLRDYQSNGLAWLLRLVRFGIGGLLADDMGLGKTHQGLALMQLLLEDNRKSSILVVCPASVVLHWAEKIDTFYPGLDYDVYYGPNRDLEKARPHNVIITTYGVVRQDSDRLQTLVFDVMLLDEIQQVKNHTTAIHQAVAGLNSRVKIGLTGTPVENSLQDLRSLFAICLPGLLGSERQFARQYVQPITERGSSEVRERLSRLIHPFILRRTRSQVLQELPDVIEDNRRCALSADQIILYKEVLDSKAGEFAGLSDDMVAIPYMHILAAITRLKQICCHPCLIAGGSDPAQYNCGKWDLFVELSEELLGAEMKFVVFSQYLGMLDLIEDYFRKEGIGVARLRGDMSANKRQRMIETFNTDPDSRVFCASLLAGGVGIDLTGAQAVIHYDRWWNPAKEEQATARVHRMGQRKVVQVFRLITVDTLEEKIHQLLQEKRQLAESLIHEDEACIIKQMDREQLVELFRVAPGLE